jgi:hypothetical protein
LLVKIAVVSCISFWFLGYSWRKNHQQARKLCLKLIELGVEWVSRLLNVPSAAIAMFKKANEVSGIDKETLPTELIPLNTIQLSRGLLNFTILQSIRTWVLPYWATNQYDPSSSAFIPRSHLGLSMNLTHRNWTAVGTMECDIEPIVDSRGMVTPFRDGWSLDVWLMVDGKLYFPSHHDAVRQRLVHDLPIVETVFAVGTLVVTLTTFVVKTNLIHRAHVNNYGGAQTKCMLFVALRPFNTEGISLVQEVEYSSEENRLLVNGKERVYFDTTPEYVDCSSHLRGDCAAHIVQPGWSKELRSHCSMGLANAVVGFTAELSPHGCYSVEASCRLHPPFARANQNTADADPVAYWKEILQAGGTLTTPDQRLNSLFTSSLSTLLVLTDSESITPGPFTYHQFWFRDAAYMLWALDKWGFSNHAERVMQAFPKKQERSGYFRSQQGEWDSNGQVLWTVGQHLLHSRGNALLEEMFDSLRRGTEWIERKRVTTQGKQHDPVQGLMPRGLSAEHLGLADYYFWDNFWSLAGLESYALMADQLEKSHEAKRIKTVIQEYRENVERAIRYVQNRFSTDTIPAGPLRDIDCGMIGSLCAWYPLQLFAPDDSRLLPTLVTLHDRFFHKGMFFQDFIHSGMNAYLTLQVAHTWLLRGERKRFWEIFATVCSFASPTMNFPEAMHPTTGGGCMGDGHHGWAAAEIVLALHDAFIHERTDADNYELILLGGVPVSWFSSGKPFSIERARVTGAIVSVHVTFLTSAIEVQISFERINTMAPRRIALRLPVVAQKVFADQGARVAHEIKNGETHIELEAASVRLRIIL